MTGAPDLTGQLILVVEDNFLIASDTVSALRDAGADILGPCRSEETTLKLLQAEVPSAAVLDLNLSGDGPEFNVAHLLLRHDIPFIFLTGYDPSVIPADLSGAAALQKPVELRQIVEAVAEAIDSHQRRGGASPTAGDGSLSPP